MSSLKFLLCLSMMLIHRSDIYSAADIQMITCDADDTEPNVHNFVVKLRIDAEVIEYGYSNLRIDFCGGSIIDERWIITAANCFQDNVTKITVMSSKERILGFAKDFVIHPYYIQDPNFNFYNGQNNLALVKTTKSIQFNAFTQPIGLARLGAQGQQVIIAGYGHYASSERLIEITDAVNQCECAPKDSTMLCAQISEYLEYENSGAALLTDDGLVGVMSAIADVPSGYQPVFVNISLHLNWIQRVTGKKLHNNGTE